MTAITGGLLMSAGVTVAFGWWLTLLALGISVYLWPKERGFFWGWWLGIGYFGNGLIWIMSPFFVDPWATGWMAPFAVIGMACGLGLFWGAAFGLAHRFGRAWLIVFWPLAEGLRGVVFTGFPWNLIGHIFTDTPILQMGAYVGAFGVTVVTMVLMTATGLGFRQSRSLGAVALIISLGVLLGAWGAGIKRLENATVELTDYTIRLVSPDAPQKEKWDPAKMPIFFKRAVEATEQEPKADMVIWPETSWPAYFDAKDTLVKDLAHSLEGGSLVLGALRLDEFGQLYNSLAFIPAEGTTQVYDKFHLVPFGEYLPLSFILSLIDPFGLVEEFGGGFKKGKGSKVIETPVGRMLPLICYESIFPKYAGFDREAVDFIVLITNDAWFGRSLGPKQHFAQARWRSVEQGLPIIRVENRGGSVHIDAYGQIHKETNKFVTRYSEDTVLSRPIEPPLYSRLFSF